MNIHDLPFVKRKMLYDDFVDFGLHPYTDGKFFLFDKKEKFFVDEYKKYNPATRYLVKMTDSEKLNIAFTRGFQKPSDVFQKSRKQIKDFLLQRGMKNPRLFGSVLHGNDTLNSDLDIIVDYKGGADFFAIQQELEELLQIPVSLHTLDELTRISHVFEEAEAL